MKIKLSEHLNATEIDYRIFFNSFGLGNSRKIDKTVILNMEQLSLLA